MKIMTASSSPIDILPMITRDDLFLFKFPEIYNKILVFMKIIQQLALYLSIFFYKNL